MIKKLIKSNEGVVGIVVAVLLIGLMVSVVSLVQSVYVPKWMEQKEAEHMNEVSSQFSHLKFAIDTQSSTGQLNSPIASSITLGSKEMPFLMSLRAFGYLDILSNSIDFNFANNTDNYQFSLGSIKYSSLNGYYLDQSFIYQAGAVIVNQYEGNMMSIKPSFVIVNDSEDVNITIKLVDIVGIGGKVSASGFGTTAIQTEYLEYNHFNLTDIDSIEINTLYPNAWEIYLNWLLEKQLEPSDYSLDINNNDITINFTNQPDLDIQIIKIVAQIGAGWIE
jgi:hypothetical protein